MSTSSETTEQLPKKKQLLYSQDKFIYSPAKFPAIVGTWGCGKSLATIYAADRECEMFQNNLYLIIRKEFVDLRDSTMKDWMDEIGKPWNGDKDVIYQNGSNLMFRHGSDIDSLKNINLGGAAIIQAEEMTESEFWFIAGRLRRQNGSLKLRIEANYNGHNWIHKLWKKKDFNIPHEYASLISLDDFHLVETNTLENSANLPPAYIASLAAMPEKLKKRHFLGSWDEAQGLCYDEYSENRHLIEPLAVPDDWERGFVLDHGFRNPTAILWYAIDFDGNIWLYDEHYVSEKGISFHAEAIKKRGITTGYCDPSLFSKNQNSNTGDIFSIADEYRDCGISLIPALKEVEKARIARVNEFFKEARILVFKTLTHFRNEINNWKWREVSGRQGELNLPEEPEDKDNHLMDDLGYLIASRFSKSEKRKDAMKDNTAAKILERINQPATVSHRYEGSRYFA